MNLNMSGVKRGLLAMYDCVSECVLSVEDGVLKNHQKPPNLWPADTTDGARKRKKAARYSIRVEYSSSNPPKPVLKRTESVIDEGGFDLKLPPNRFRTRSVAIVAGYCPERLYSNMPPGAFVVESGVYKVGADRDYVKSEPIYWKQVVYGGAGGGGSEGSGGGTYPRTGPETQILHEPRLVAEANLELRQTGGPGTARLRASSPLDQDRPLTEFLSPAGNQSDISSVPHPSSAERSLPSTLLTNPQSSLSSPNLSLEQTQSSSRTRSSRFPSLRTIPEDSRLSVQADIHASDYSNLAEYSSGLAADSPVSARLEQLYRQNISYLGHHGFPGFPGYPFIAPVHRAISPSKQYPAYVQPAQHIQPPRIADIGVVGVDQREVDIYQRIAQIDPETEHSQRPLATSSPPHKRKAEADVEAGGGGGRRSVQKPRFPTPPGRRVSSTSSPTGRVVTFDTLNLSQRSAGQPASQSGGQRRVARPGVLRHRKNQSEEERDVDTVSVVSEGLADAEVTAITSSSSPGSSGSNTLQPGDRKTEEREERSESSGIASKNTSNLTSSSHSTSAGSASLHHSSLSPENLSAVITTSKLSKRPPSSSLLSSKLERLEDTILYENWPPRPQQYLAVPTQVALTSVTSGVPPFIIHPASSRARSRTAVSSPDTSIDSPASRSSRPNSSQSAPLDRSVDRHYEWDRATVDDSSLPSLPPEWAVRRSPAYNPRRDRDLGHLVTQSTRERVFSDSEIYSNVFPRRRLQQDVEARVRAMKKEFKEFRKSQNASPIDSDRLESLI